MAHKTKVVTLLALAARTATGTGTGVSTGSEGTQPITGGSDGFTRHMLVFLSCTAAAGGTLDISIEGSMDGGTTYVPLTPSSPWVQVLAAGTSEQARRYDGPLPALIRALGTGASTPDHTYSVTAVLGG